MDFRFEWDAAKAASNLKKHGIDFDVAIEVFFDPCALQEQDRIEGGEPRWRTIGMAGNLTILVVAHTSMDDANGTEIVRIISARRATPRERMRYG